MDPTIVILLLLGFALLIVSSVVMTTYGEKYPLPVLIGLFAAFAVYIAIILVRIGVFDLP